MLKTAGTKGKTLPPKLLYARRDVAHALSISLRSVDHLIANGQIKTRKLGNRVMVSDAELRRFADTDHDTLTSTQPSTDAADRAPFCRTTSHARLT